MAQRMTVQKRLTASKGRYVYMVVCATSDNSRYNVAGFTTKPRAEKFRRICQADFDEMFTEYDKRVKAGLGVLRQRFRSQFDLKLDWIYPATVTYLLEEISVSEETRNLTLVARGVKYDRDRAIILENRKLKYHSEKDLKEFVV